MEAIDEFEDDIESIPDEDNNTSKKETEEKNNANLVYIQNNY